MAFLRNMEDIYSDISEVEIEVGYLKYEGRTESHEQLFFCMGTGNSRRRRVRW